MNYLAQNGFIGVVLQHPGSDSALLRGERRPARAIESLRAGMDAPRSRASATCASRSISLKRRTQTGRWLADSISHASACQAIPMAR